MAFVTSWSAETTGRGFAPLTSVSVVGSVVSPADVQLHHLRLLTDAAAARLDALVAVLSTVRTEFAARSDVDCRVVGHQAFPSVIDQDVTLTVWPAAMTALSTVESPPPPVAVDCALHVAGRGGRIP